MIEIIDLSNEPKLLVILGLYTATVLFQCIVLGTGVMAWGKLPKRFRVLCFLSVLCFLTAFSICLFHLLTRNAASGCNLGRKLAYSLFYIGFLIFDYYQTLKIKILTGADGWKGTMLYLSFLARIASYGYNVWSVNGVAVSMFADNTGPCTTQFTSFSVYQEHTVSILFQVILGIHILFFVWNSSTKEASFSARLRKIVDTEIICFCAYLIVEIIYIVVFYALQSNLVSINNAIYLNVPVILFSINIIQHISNRQNRIKSMIDVSKSSEVTLIFRNEFQEFMVDKPLWK